MRSDRLLATLLLLQTYGRMSATDLAGRLEVSTRTVYRDVDALSAAGVPVYTERGRLGGVALVPGYRTDASGLTADEARALFVFAGRDAGAAVGLDAALSSALRKLMSALPAAQRPDVDRARERVIVDPRHWGRQAEHLPHLDLLQQAVWTDRRVRVTYLRSDQVAGVDRPGTYTLDPYGLLVKAGVWYLIAAHRGETRIFRVSRVDRATLLRQPATRPAELDLEAEWRRLQRVDERGDGVPVVLRVRSERTAMLFRMYRFAMTTQPKVDRDHDADGWDTVTASFRAEAEAVAMLLAFAADVEVVSPGSLRRSLRDRAREVVRLYS